MMTTKSAAINNRVIAEYNSNGGDIREAIDTVLGAGSYAKMAGELYDALRAKGGR